LYIISRNVAQLDLTAYINQELIELKMSRLYNQWKLREWCRPLRVYGCACETVIRFRFYIGEH